MLPDGLSERGTDSAEDKEAVDSQHCVAVMLQSMIEHVFLLEPRIVIYASVDMIVRFRVRVEVDQHDDLRLLVKHLARIVDFVEMATRRVCDCLVGQSDYVYDS